MNNKTNWLMLTHLSALIPGVGIICPFILWQVKKEEFPEIEQHAKAVLNFIITVFIAGVISSFVPVIGGFVMWVVGLFFIFQVVMAALSVSKGAFYTYLLSFQFIK